MPAPYPVLIDGQGARAWEALDWKILKEVKNSVAQYRLKSPYTQSLLQHIFSAMLLMPHDTRMIMQILLSPSQQLQFFQHWQQGCDRAAATPGQQGDPLYGVQAQMLLGAGPFIRVDWQVQFATEVLQLSQDLAFKALAAVHDDKISPAFTTVKQGPGESFAKFINRLHGAIMAHPDMTEDMKAKFLDFLAFENANDKTKRALSLLPRGANTGALLEAADHMLEQEKATVVAAAVGAAVRTLVANQKKEKKDQNCFSCGKRGHYQRECGVKGPNS